MIDTRYNEMLENGEFDDIIVNVNEVLENVQNIWGDLDDDRGCYCNGNWMSIKDFVKIVVDNAYPLSDVC